MGLDIYFSKIRKKYSEVGYFRKVNFLVSFVEEYLGREIGNCEEVPFTREMTEDLILSCKKVLEAKENIEDYCKSQNIPENETITSDEVAKDLLPTCPGFFFGGTEYNEWYYQDVKEVLTWCQDTLLPEFDNLGENEKIYFSIWY